MAPFVSTHLHPPLHEPIMLVALEGWIDAGAAAATAIQAVLDGHHSEPVATFDADSLLDHRARRPVMTLIEGHIRHLAWPSVELRGLTDRSGRHVVALVGAEPDHSWQRFTESVVDLALDLGVQMMVGLGAYPAAVPHTRPTQLALTSPSEDLLASFTGFVRGSVEVPAGVQAAVEVAAAEAGIPAVGLWAQVPHYVAGMPYAPASIALVEGVGRISGLDLTSGSLPEDAEAGRSHLDELVAGNPQHQAMVGQLEEIYDAAEPSTRIEPLPTGDELAAEFQAFLREQGDDG